jgi:hypothetical protein
VLIDSTRIFSLDNAGKRQPLAPNKAVRGRLSFRNTGQTPAHHTEARVITGLVDWPPDADTWAVEPPAAGARASLGAGIKLNIPFDLPALPEATYRKLCLGTTAFVVFGEIRYRDIFNKQRRTKFRLFLSNAVEIGNMRLLPHSEGNEVEGDDE